MRYFMFSCAMQKKESISFGEYGITRNDFPTRTEFLKVVKSYNSNYDVYVILSVSEMSQDDFNTYFEGNIIG